MPGNGLPRRAAQSEFAISPISPVNDGLLLTVSASRPAGRCSVQPAAGPRRQSTRSHGKRALRRVAMRLVDQNAGCAEPHPSCRPAFRIIAFYSLGRVRFADQRCREHSRIDDGLRTGLGCIRFRGIANERDLAKCPSLIRIPIHQRKFIDLSVRRINACISSHGNRQRSNASNVHSFETSRFQSSFAGASSVTVISQIQLVNNCPSFCAVADRMDDDALTEISRNDLGMPAEEPEVLMAGVLDVMAGHGCNEADCLRRRRTLDGLFEHRRPEALAAYPA